MTKEQVSKSSSSLKPVVPTEEAVRRIEEQIEIGLGIRNREIFSEMDWSEAQKRRITWLEANIETVTRLFNNPSFTEEYKRDISFVMDTAITFGLMEKNFKDDINEQIWKLRSLLKSLQLTPKNEVEELVEQNLAGKPIIQEQPKEIQPKEILLKEVIPGQAPPMETPPVKRQIKKESFRELSSKEKPQKEGVSKEAPNRIKPLEEEPVSTIILKRSQLLKSNILLVHSCDRTINQSVLEFVEKLEPRASILHGQPNGGRSIIEKLGESSNIDFAIFLFAPDDFAISRDKPKEKQIPFSQNVIFEFGYFVGKLGPGKVCALYKEELEIPWDYSGAVCIPMDFRGGWRLLVAKEIKQAGIEIDLNKAI